MQRIKTRALDNNNESTNQNKNNSNEIIAKNSVLMIYSGPACYSLRRSGEYKYLIQDRAGVDNIWHSQGRVLDLGREVYMPCALWAATSMASTASTTSNPTIEITRALGCPLLPVQTKELEKKNHKSLAKISKVKQRNTYTGVPDSRECGLLEGAAPSPLLPMLANNPC